MSSAVKDGFSLDPDNDRWVNSPDHFDPIDQYTYVEIACNTSEVQYRTQSMKDKDIPTICAEDSEPDHKWNSKLQQPRPSWNNRKIPFSSQTTEALKTRWRIPTDNGFQPVALFSSGFLHFKPSQKEPSWERFIFIDAYSSGFRFSLAISHNSSTKATYTVLFGILNQRVDTLTDRLRDARQYAFHPLLFPLILLDIKVSSTRAFQFDKWNKFTSIKYLMKCNVYTNDQVDSKELDLVELPRELTKLSHATASITAVVGASVHTAKFLEANMSLNTGQALESQILTEKLEEHLALQLGKLKYLERGNNDMKDSITAQVQMVYALLAQRDNELNHRYGADMRIIAAVTLVFLPGTFVATFFSASFWNFEPSNTGSIVSKWVWLYWLITFILTTITLGTWRGVPKVHAFWRKKKNGEHPDEKKDV